MPDRWPAPALARRAGAVRFLVPAEQHGRRSRLSRRYSRSCCQWRPWASPLLLTGRGLNSSTRLSQPAGESCVPFGLALFEIGPHQSNQVFGQLLGRLGRAMRAGDMETNVVLENFRHQAVYAAANGGQQHENVGALIAFADGALDGVDLTGQALDAGEQLLFFLGDFRRLVFHQFSLPALNSA